MQIRIDPCISIKLTHDCVRTAAFCQSIKEPVVISSPSGQPPGPRQFPSQRFWTKIHPGCGAEPVSTIDSVCLGIWLSIVLFCLRSLFIGQQGAWNIRPQGGKPFQNSSASFTCKQAALLSFSVTAYPSSGGRSLVHNTHLYHLINKGLSETRMSLRFYKHSSICLCHFCLKGALFSLSALRKYQGNTKRGVPLLAKHCPWNGDGRWRFITHSNEGPWGQQAASLFWCLYSAKVQTFVMKLFYVEPIYNGKMEVLLPWFDEFSTTCVGSDFAITN